MCTRSKIIADSKFDRGACKFVIIVPLNPPGGSSGPQQKRARCFDAVCAEVSEKSSQKLFKSSWNVVIWYMYLHNVVLSMKCMQYYSNCTDFCWEHLFLILSLSTMTTMSTYSAGGRVKRSTNHKVTPQQQIVLKIYHPSDMKLSAENENTFLVIIATS